MTTSHVTCEIVSVSVTDSAKELTCIVVTALCNQSEAFAMDFSDDQSCYL